MNNIMYEYKLDISEENKELYKSVYKRTTIFRLAILVLINCIILGTLLFLYFSLILKRYLKVFMIVILISILIEIIAFILVSKKRVKSIVNRINSNCINIDFYEEGIKIIEDDIEKVIKWNAINAVYVNKDYITFNYSITLFKENTFLFKGFDVSRDEIINEVKKYKSVKEVGGVKSGD